MLGRGHPEAREAPGVRCPPSQESSKQPITRWQGDIQSAVPSQSRVECTANHKMTGRHPISCPYTVKSGVNSQSQDGKRTTNQLSLHIQEWSN